MISWICLVLVSMSVMLFIFASVKDWVSETLELILHVHLTSNAPSLSGSLQHLFEDLQVFLWGSFSEFTFNTIVSLIFHLLSSSVISITISITDEFSHVISNLREVVGSVSDLIWYNIKSFQVSDNVLDKLKFFFEWIGVIKTKDHLSFVNFGVVIIDHSGLYVTNMKET